MDTRSAQLGGAADVREYAARAASTDTFGRVLCTVRNHHFVIDGPVQNGCPGEEVTPAELFLAAVASCGAELLQVLARQREMPVPTVNVYIRGIQDRSNPARPDYSVFNTVHMRFHLKGVSQQQGADLIEAFKRR
jgi:uncharacterized OsmC-like protein